MNFLYPARATLGLALLTVTLGCARVRFYSDSDLSKPAGIPIYASKPYILVSRTGSKDKPVDVSVVYISDPQRVTYAVPEPGLGSAKLSLALANGQLTSLGQETDPKIAELIGAMGTLMTARAGASKTEAEAEAIRAKIGLPQQGTVSCKEIGEKILDIASDISQRLKEGTLKGLTNEEVMALRGVAQALNAAGKLLADPSKAPSAPQQLDVIRAQIGILGGFSEPTSLPNERNTSLQIVRAFQLQLSKHLASIPQEKTEKTEPPAFELYEVVQNTYGVTLKRITQ